MWARASLFRRFADTDVYTEPVSLDAENSPQNVRRHADIFHGADHRPLRRPL